MPSVFPLWFDQAHHERMEGLSTLAAPSAP